MFKIGFFRDEDKAVKSNLVSAIERNNGAPRKSVVQVYFPEDGRTLAYYNDLFDLHIGDFVYVEGQLEGIRGRIKNVNYNFKIKLSEYKRVIQLVDTEVHGQLYFAGSHMVAFDRNVIPAAKIRSWFMANGSEDEEYASGNDDVSFPLSDLKEMDISPKIAERGHNYYMDSKVRYLCLDGTSGYAIVEGTEPYDVEFTYADGNISNLTCTCFCSYNCKHEFAAMLQLRETLELISKNYEYLYAASGYFAAIFKSTLMNTILDKQENGSITL